MAGKEAILVILDVGPSMNSRYQDSDSQSRLDLGIDSIKLLIQQKLLFSKNHALGIVLFGTEETENDLNAQMGGYENITVASALEVPSLNLVRFMDQIQTTPQSADFVDALVVGVDMLVSFCGKKKYNKRIFLITDGNSKVNDADLNDIVSTMNENEIKLNVM